jgi:hypothetical protein
MINGSLIRIEPRVSEDSRLITSIKTCLVRLSKVKTACEAKRRFFGKNLNKFKQLAGDNKHCKRTEPKPLKLLAWNSMNKIKMTRVK